MAVTISIAEIKGRIDELEREISRLTVQREALVELIEYAKFARTIDGSIPLAQGARDRLGPREAIIKLVQERPGLTPTEIADTLKDQVASRASDVRNVLRTTAAKLATEGRLRRDDETNKLYPANEDGDS